MAVCTSTAFRNLLQNMSVEGVTRHYPYPPQSLNKADLPAAFLAPPVTSSVSGRLSTCIGDSKSRSARFIVCLQPIMLDTQEINYDLLDPMIDNLETALASTFTSIAYFYDYEMSGGIFDVGGVSYWSVIATVSIRSSYE